MSDTDESVTPSTRLRAPSRKKLANSLVDLTFTFNELTKRIQKSIESVDEALDNPEDLEKVIQTLIELKERYRNTICEMNQLFLQDKWGESTEVKPTVEAVSSKYLKIIDSKILEGSSKLEFYHQQQEKQSPSGKASLKRSSCSGTTRISKASSSVERQKAVAEAAAAKKQVQYDILIADREKERKKIEAAEERKRAEAKAQHDHDIAVIKARMKAAVAEAKRNAIEQMIDEEESEFGSKKSARAEIDIDREGGSEAHMSQTRYDIRSWVLSQQNDLEGDPQELRTRFNFQRTESNGEKNIKSYPEVYFPRSDLVETNKKLSESLARISLPKCHPDVYSGDVTMFHPWKNSFQGMIRDCYLSPEQEMNYLSKYTAGEPQKLVNSFRRRHSVNVTKLLKDLWDELESRFGNVAIITNELVRRLRQSARFEEQDRKKLQAFSDLCADVASQMIELPGLSCLNYPNVLQPIFRNLPSSICYKWEEKIVDYALKNNDEYPNFNEFSSFIKKQALLKNHANVIANERNEKRKGKESEEQSR